MRILVLDNYDSFTYNLVHILRELGYGGQTDVIRNDKISVDGVAAYDKILLSPGPGIPEEAGILMDLIKTHGPTKSILGVCLGEQGIGEAFGATLYNLDTVLHGLGMRTDVVKDDLLFEGLPKSFQCGRYHSWAVSTENLPKEIEVTALGEDGVIMGLRHATYDVRGVQFHPESVLTEHGVQLVKNWVEYQTPAAK